MTFLMGVALGSVLVFSLFWCGIVEIHQPTKEAEIFTEIDRLYDRVVRNLARD